MRRYFGPATWLFLGIWFVLMIGGRSRFFQDPGTFWHVATGNQILANGFIDRDPFTFTFAGTEWIPYQWLGECAMAILDRVGGFDLLLVATCTILAGVFTGLGARLIGCGLHPSVVAVVLAAGIAASSGHFHVRPHLATIAGMAVLMVYLTDFESGRVSVARLLWLIPIFWLWANTHGGALGGLATLGLAVGAWTAKWRLRGGSPVTSWRDAGRLALIVLGCAGMSLAGPYGYRLPADWLQIYRMQSLPHIIKEHSPLDLGEWAGLSTAAFGSLYCVLLGTVPIRRWRVTWLLPVVWLVLAFTRVRHGPLFAVTALVAIAEFFRLSRIAVSLVRKKSDLFDPNRAVDAEASVRDSARPFAIPAGLVLATVLIQLTGAQVPILGRGWARLDPAIWPTDLLPELREHQYDRPGGTRIFCEYAYGGFLIYYTPGYRVFIDDRCEVFGDAFLVRFVRTREELQRLVESGKPEGELVHPAQPFAEWQAEYGSFDFALVETGGGFDLGLAELPQAWEVIRQRETATLYRRKISSGP